MLNKDKRVSYGALLSWKVGLKKSWYPPEVVDGDGSVLCVGAARRLQTLRHRLLIPKPFKPLTAKTERDENTQRERE